jgi:radical SAM family uncharacterized protein/radical SAM-linked protein
MSSLSKKIEIHLLPHVEKPFRYSGGELNTYTKDQRNITVSGVLCFPEIYDIGMSHYGSQILYHLINREEQWSLTRAYMPWDDAEKILREKDIPLYSLEDRRSIADADWVGFSLQYELQYTNLVTMLELGNIPVFSRDRSEDDPLVIAGGPVTANPEPVADFIDIFFPGDGETALKEFCQILEQSKNENKSRNDTIAYISSRISSAYVPARYPLRKLNNFLIPHSDSPVKADKIPVLSENDLPKKQIVPLGDAVHNRMAVEVMRGCTQGCRFCSAGMYYRPVRERNVDDIMEQISYGTAETGWNDITLLSLSTADYTAFGDLLCSVAAKKAEYHTNISLPSTRIDAVSEEEFRLFDTLSGSSSITIAPEAGSQRLRNVINKNFTTETILTIVEKICTSDIKTIKLYFMVGLPTETMADIEEMIQLIESIQTILKKDIPRGRLNVSLSPFSPKPHTPFQWHGFAGKEAILERCRRVKSYFHTHKSVKISYRDPDVSYLETVLSRGDRQLSQVIYRAQKKGARFDGWRECFNLERWQDAAQDCDVDLSIYVSPAAVDAHLPWHIISMGVTQNFLKGEMKKAMEEKITRDCRRGCIQCGVCGKDLQMTYAHSNTTLSPENMRRALQEEKTQPSGHPELLRIVYAKKPQLRFLSHQHTANILIRAFSAARVPVAFSQGMRPRPKFSFGPPLPQGACGENELFDVTLSSVVHPLPLKQIHKYLPRGLGITTYHSCTGKHKALNAQVTHADWQIEILSSGIDSHTMEQRVAEFLQRTTCTVERKRKNKKSRLFNIIPLTSHLTCENNSIRVTLSAEPGNSCKPAELLSVLFPEAEYTDFLITRLQLYTRTPQGISRVLR